MIISCIIMALINTSRIGDTPIVARLLTLILGLAFGTFGGCDRPSSDQASTAPKLEYGTKVSFGKDGNSDPFKSSGWSTTEEKFTWSEGTSAVLRMAIAPTSDTIVLKIAMAALIKEPELPSQPVGLEINGHQIAKWDVGNTAEFTATLPQDLTKAGGVVSITLKTPKATSPKALGQSSDPRVLGVCCVSMVLAKS